MTRYLIIVRNPQRRVVIAIQNDEGQVELFDTEDAAEQAARSIPVCQAWPYSIVEAP